MPQAWKLKKVAPKGSQNLPRELIPGPMVPRFALGSPNNKVPALQGRKKEANNGINGPEV